jgi:hypothetical protein
LSNIFFGIPELDALLPSTTPTNVELISPLPTHHTSGAGKTSLLYLIIAYAILPASFFSISLSGQNGAVIVFDPLHHFNVPRLASIIFNILVSKAQEAGKDISTADVKSLVAISLFHVHIYRPQSWASLVTTLRSVPDYLFDATRHKSIHRRIHSIVLEDIDTFVWPIRNATSPSIGSTTNHLGIASAQLTSALRHLTVLLSCGVVITSQSTTPTSFRPPLPLHWPQTMSTTRLAVRRVDVLKFAPAISVEDAETEKAQRWEVVAKGRFECWKVGVGVRDGEGFVFRVEETGIAIENREGK